MKILYFFPYSLSTPHFEAALEIIQNHIDNKDKVYFYHCNGGLKSCESNYLNNYDVCLPCISRKKNGISKITGNYKAIDFLNLNKKEKSNIRNIIEKLELKDISDLKKFNIENVDIGYAVASSLISYTRNPLPDLIEYKELYQKLLFSSLSVYFSFKKVLTTKKPDKVYIHNGRYSTVRPILRLCQKINIDCYIEERGSKLDKYYLYKNTLPHNIDATINRIKEFWQQYSGNKIEKATEFYENRKNGIEQNWYSFVKNQEYSQLPVNWDIAKKNIVIFNSSEDEFASIDDQFNLSLYKDQLDGITQIIDSFRNKSDYHFYLRIHPNLKNVKNSSVADLYKIKSGNFTIIPPDSTVSTYNLMLNANQVITFGSTTGIEAAFWGIPSILVGISFYKNLGSTYNPATHDELIELIEMDLKPLDKTGAYMYGLYLNEFGIPFKYYKADSIAEGKYKGENISINNNYKRILNLVSKNKYLTRYKNIINWIYFRFS